MSSDADVVVVGAGAAGLATAIFGARHAPGRRIVVLDGARRLGAKILVSGGGRCNVTNRRVSASDYWGGDRRFVASVLRAFSAEQAADFFTALGVPLHEEERGKLFPDSNRARSVLDALLSEASRLGIRVQAGERVTGIERGAGGWRVCVGAESMEAARVVVASGGLSLPKTGSDGAGLRMVGLLGHRIVPTTPGLVPLVLDGSFHPPLSGVSHEASIDITAEGNAAVARVRGPLLWTHFGISGPAALDASRHCLRHEAEGRRPRARLSFVPELDFAAVERALIEVVRQRPSGTVRAALAAWLPESVGGRLLDALRLDGAGRLSQLPREDRRRLAHALTSWELPVKGSRGYNYAEVTAGGVALDEVDRRTMESRLCPGLHLVGEMLDVDGRLGGFNFQWAWATGFVAGRAVGR